MLLVSQLWLYCLSPYLQRNIYYISHFFSTLISCPVWLCSVLFSCDYEMESYASEISIKFSIALNTVSLNCTWNARYHAKQSFHFPPILCFPFVLFCGAVGWRKSAAFSSPMTLNSWSWNRQNNANNIKIVNTYREQQNANCPFGDKCR